MHIKKHKPADVFHHQLITARQIYEEMKDSPYPADRLLGNFFHRRRGKFGSIDRKVISEAVYGMFRHKLFLEAWQNSEGLKAPLFLPAAALVCEGLLDQSDFRELVNHPRAGDFYQALREAKIPPGVSHLTQTEVFSLIYSFPLWMVERWIQRFGEEGAENFLRAMNQRPPLVLRVNPLKVSRDFLITRLRAKGHLASPTELSPWGVRVQERFNVFDLEEFRDGFFEVQDEGSQLVALAVDPKPSEVVWDVCAGGGGKTLFVAALMQNKGRVIATDIRSRKLEDLRKRAKRAGIFNVFPADLQKLNQSAVMRRGVDAILVDAPCSGTGTLRRNPDAKWKLTPDKLLKFQADQLKIMDAYCSYLKPGGRLIYSTCSVEPEENERVVETFLASHPEFERLGPDRYLYPRESGTDGFFIANMRNNSWR